MNYNPQLFSDRPLHDASAYLPSKRHVPASVADHHQAVVSTLTPAQAQAVAQARVGIYPYVPTPPHSAAAAAAEAANRANSMAMAAAAAYQHSIATGPGGSASGAPPGASHLPQLPPGASLNQLGHLNHHSLGPLFPFGSHPPPPGSHNGAIVPGPGPVYRELSDRYAQELLLNHNIERLKREDNAIANAIAAADQNAAAVQYYNRFAGFTGGLSLAGINPTVAAAIVASQQQAQNNLHQAIATSSSAINSTATSLSASTSSSSSSRRRPSLLPHNAPQSAEAFNLALTNSITSTNSSTNGSNSVANAQSNNSRGSSHYVNDREKFDLFRYSSPYENVNRGSKSSQNQSSSDRSGPSPLDRLPSSSAASSSSPYAHLSLSQSSAPMVSVNSHHHSLPPGLVSGGGPTLLIPPLGVSVPSSMPPGVGQPTVSFHPTIVISSAATTSSHHHPSVVASHHSTPSSASQHHQALPPSHQHSSSTFATHLQHNHPSPGHLIGEINEAKRPRLMSYSNDVSSNSFAAALAAANAAGANSSSGAGMAPGTASITGGQPGRPLLNQELLVDTRASNDAKDKDYTSNFEAISPTPNEESQSEVQMQTAKDEILGSIHALDREIWKVENHINTLNKRAQELEEVTSKPPTDLEENKQKSEPKEPTIEQKIYSQNNLLATKAHQQFARLGPLNDLPLYNQAIDLAIVEQNHQRYLLFRKTLIARIRKQNAERSVHVKCLCETYDKSIREWLKKMEKKECTPTKKAKDQKLRDYFERQFQELKKQREDRERLQRSGQRVRSEAEMDEILDGLQVQAMEDQKMRSYAVIPPIMYDEVLQPRPRFDNRNGYIEDPMELYKEVKGINIWTEGEKEIFREKYLQHPKNFGLIASFLERKSVADCVQYYYLSKKTENYKQLLKKHAKKRTRALAKQQQQANAQANRGSPMIKELERTQQSLKPYPQSATSVILPYATPLTSSSSTITFTISAPSAASVQAKVSTSTVTSILNKTSSTLTTTSAGSASTSVSGLTTRLGDTNNNASGGDSAVKCGDSDNEEHILHGEGGADSATAVEPDTTCCKCSDRFESQAKYRAVTSANVSLYSIDEYRPGLRVCLKCHLKHVRRQCPIASCNTRRKLKRLKALPTQWVEMPIEKRQLFAAELDIPVDAKIGCARCVMRISRRIGIVTNSTSASSVVDVANSIVNASDSAMPQSAKSSSSSKADIRRSWTEAEIDQLRMLIRQHGKNWQQIAAGFGGIKSANDCKKLFFSNKRECNLASALHEYNESTGRGNAKLDTDSDDELSDDSGEETSSVEDIDRNSDTASASSQVEPMSIDSPLKTPTIPAPSQQHSSGSLQDLKALSASQGSLKSDYDSSATMSADEGNPPESGTAGASASASTFTSTASVCSGSTSALFSRTGAPLTSTSSLFGPSRSTFNLLSTASDPPAIPSFLINPNAPSCQTNHHISSPALPHFNHSLAAGLAGGSPLSALSANGSAGSVKGEEPTCVRDLIYKAIEMSLQPPEKDGQVLARAPSVPIEAQHAAAAAQLRPNSTSSEPANYQALNLKRANTPNDLSKMDLLASTAAAMQSRKPEGFYPSYYGASAHAEDEAQDLSKKPTVSMPDRKPTPSQLDALIHRPSSRGSPYKQDKLSVSSSPGLRASPSLKSQPQASTTPTLFQQQFGSGMPQPAHSNQSISPALAYQLDPKALPKGFSPANMLPILQQQQHHHQQSQSTPPLDRNKLKQQQQQPSVLMPKMESMPLILQTHPPGSKATSSYVQLSPKSSNSSAATSAAITQSYRDKMLIPGIGSITQGTPVVIPGQQLPPPPPGKFAPPQSMASMQFNPAQSNAPTYETMLRRMNATGSITAGTPLSVSQPPPIPGLPVSVSMSSAGRKDALDLKATSSLLPRGAGNHFDPSVFEQFYKRNSSPNSQAIANAAYHRPFSPNFQSPYAPPPPPPGKPPNSNASSSSSAKDPLANQILIDFNTSKQMQPRRSSASSEKEHSNVNNGGSSDPLKQHRPPSHGQASFNIAPSPSPNSSIYLAERQNVIRNDEQHHHQQQQQAKLPPIGVPPPPGAPPGTAEHLAQWQHLTGLGYNLTNRQNVIQQWPGASLPPPVSTPPNATKASVIQAPKSSSPRDLLVQNAEHKRNSVSPLVTGGTSASAHFPPGADAFATLVNAAVQQKSLVVPGGGGSGRLSDAMAKPPSAEGFEKCLIDNITHHQQHSNKQTARIVYPPSQEDLNNDLNKKGASEEQSKSRLKVEASDNEMKRYSPAPGPFHGLIQPPAVHHMTAAEGERFFLEQRKKMEMMAAAVAAAAQSAGNGPSSGDRFRSVEALANSSNSASLKFAREPFSHEHFERELRQNDFAARQNMIPEHENSEAKRINPMKPSAEQMDEASKLFSQSFQKDSHHASNSGGHLTAANLIDAIITRQINTDSTSSKGNAPPNSTAGSTSSGPGGAATGPGLSNFAMNRFRSGLEGAPSSSATPPAVSNAQQARPPSRPSSTSSGQLHPPLLPMNHKSNSEPNSEAEDGAARKAMDSAAAAAAAAASTVPAGSLRETIFNVISNNFVSSPSAHGGVGNSTLDPKKLAGHQAIIEGIAASITSPNSAAVDKLRKALQPGEKHLLDGLVESSPAKRPATDAEMLRQQVIHLASSGKGNSMEPISPPQHNDTTSSAPSSSASTISATVTAATHWPPVQHQQAPPPPVSISSGQWTSMPTISLFDTGLRVTNSGNANSPNINFANRDTHSTAVTSGFASFFQNRIEEAMRDTAAETSSSRRSVSPKTNDSLTKITAADGQLNSNASSKITYPDSPSSPPEMVIDENRAPSVSPDIKSNDAHPLRGFAFEMKKPDSGSSGESRSSTPGSAGVIKKHAINENDSKSNSKDATHPNAVHSNNSCNANTAATGLPKPALAEPQYDDLSDDDNVSGGRES